MTRIARIFRDSALSCSSCRGFVIVTHVAPMGRSQWQSYKIKFASSNTLSVKVSKSLIKCLEYLIQLRFVAFQIC